MSGIISIITKHSELLLVRLLYCGKHVRLWIVRVGKETSYHQLAKSKSNLRTDNHAIICYSAIIPPSYNDLSLLKNDTKLFLV